MMEDSSRDARSSTSAHLVRQVMVPRTEVVAACRGRITVLRWPPHTALRPVKDDLITCWGAHLKDVMSAQQSRGTRH
jgi:hypothetical protein